MNVYTVGQLANYLKEFVESDPFLGDLWLNGELSNVSRSSAGHLYFTLKDATGQVRSVMFRSAVKPGVAAEDGAAVLAHGRISFYEARGDLQFIADALLPQGAGALHMEFQRLMAKLEAEGLFAPSRKRALPEFPKRIALVTSPTGAVLQDIISIIGRRYPLAELVLAPVPVQGETAAAAIETAFKRLNQRDDIDLVILARGGGSLEELWPFNEERTARAVYGSRAPVVSAVGHETDYTIVDYVADLRAPTPSAAAELATPNRLELQARLLATESWLKGAMVTLIDASRDEVQLAMRRLLQTRIDIDRERQRVDDLTRTALLLSRSVMVASRAQINQQLAVLASLDPLRTLERGYAVVHNRQTGGVVAKRAQVRSGDSLNVQVSDGSFNAVAEGVVSGRPRKPRVVPQEQLTLPIRHPTP